MRERIKQLKAIYGLTDEQIAKAAGMARQTVIRQLSGRYEVNIKIATAMLQLCPDVSPDWLLFGTGNIMRPPELSDIVSRLDRVEKMLLAYRRGT